MKTIFKLDHNGDYLLHINYSLQNQLEFNFTYKNSANPEFCKKIIQSTDIHVNNNQFEFDSKNLYQVKPTILLESPYHIKIYIAEQLVFYRVIKSNSDFNDQISLPFSISETRLIAMDYFHGNPIIPFTRNKQYTLLTDLHTHFDAVLLPYELLNIALKKNLVIDTDALKTVLADKGISADFKETTIELSQFKDIYPNAYRFIADKLSISSGRIIPFGELEEIYACRDLITDHIILFAEILKKIGRSCREQGIQYIELSMNNILKDDWLAIASQTVEEIQKKYQVTIRFLAAIYNYNTDPQICDDLKRIQEKSFSPYIVGLDFSGHEQYNFYERNIIRYMEYIAEWISKYNPTFVMRVHAGENSLHLENISTILEIAQKYPVFMRIGHGIYGWNSFNFSLFNKLKNRVIIELNPDSNLALNNIQNFNQLPIKQLTQYQIPVVFGTDGSGFYRTNSKQTVISAFQGGATEETLELVNTTERIYIQFQKKQYRIKSQQMIIRKKLFKLFPFKQIHLWENLDKKSAEKISLISLTDIATRKPIYLVSNVRISSANLTRFYLMKLIQAITNLVISIDPSKAFFLVNSAKTELTTILKFIVNMYNSENKGQHHDIICAITREQKSFNPFTKISISDSLTDFPKKIIQYLQKNNGCMFVFSGDAVTNDIILQALNSETLFYLFSDGTIIDAYKQAAYSHNITVDQMLTVISKDYSELIRESKQLTFLPLTPIFCNTLIAKTLIEYGDQDYRTLKEWRARQELWKLADLAIEPGKHTLQEMGFPHISGQSEEIRILCAQLLHNSAEWHYKKGHYDEAHKILLNAEEICHNLKESQLVLGLIADIYMAYGRLFTWQSNTYQKCVSYLAKAHLIMKAIYGVNAEKTLRAFGAIAVGHNKFGNPKKAIEIFHTLLENLELIKNDWQEAGYNANLAEIYFEQKNFTKVEHHAKQAERVYSYHNHPQKYCFFNTLGFSYLKANNGPKSGEYFNHARKDYESNPDNSSIFPINVAEAYYGLMLVNSKFQNNKAAFLNLKKCVRVIEDKKLDIKGHRNFVNFIADSRKVISKIATGQSQPILSHL